MVVLAATNYEQPTQSSAVVLIRTANTLGTAFHIGEGLFLTAEHNVPPDTPLSLFQGWGSHSLGIPTIVWADNPNDVALLALPVTPDISALKLACRTPIYGEPIRINGFASGRLLVTVWGNIAGGVNKRGHVPIDATIDRGMSGSPVLDERGRVVGLLQLVLSQNFLTARMRQLTLIKDYGFIRPADQICDLMTEHVDASGVASS